MGIRSAAELDGLLGDPFDDSGPFSYRAGAELDRAEEFPVEFCAQLDRWGVQAHYVPREYGGALGDHAHLAEVVRVLARRDLTVAVGHAKTFLGTVCVWLAGTEEQAEGMARAVLDGAAVSWGLTERGHGSDLLAGELTAAPDPGGYRVDGEKWLINNATRSVLLTLLARTAAEGGARGFSLLLADKRRLAEGSYTCLPRVPTHGIRGADISGISFHGAVLPEEALIGPVGGGLEVVLKALQLTRTVCATLSLGAADQAIEQATRFTRSRILYGRALSDMPHVRRTLGEAHAMRLVAEAVSKAAADGVREYPGELSVLSAVTKAFVPALTDELIFKCGELLGTRAFLTEVHDHGAFQKLARDHRIVSIFDGNSFVNENALINQFPMLAKAYRAGTVARPACGPFDPGQLRLASRTGCSLVQRLPELAPNGGVQGRELADHCAAVHEEMARVAPSARDVPAGAFALARRYELCLAGAAVLAAESDPVRVAAGLAVVLNRLAPGSADPSVYERLLEEVSDV
jgi:alkylation response protein AidB-like acyl-CoA dehydrogenase